jgi:hypothetical protein
METVSQWLVHAILPTLGAGLLTMGIGLAKQHIARLKDEKLKAALLALVQAAEQIYGPGKGEAKRRYVREKMKQAGLQSLSREDMEAAVYQMKAANS